MPALVRRLTNRRDALDFSGVPNETIRHRFIQMFGKHSAELGLSSALIREGQTFAENIWSHRRANF